MNSRSMRALPAVSAAIAMMGLAHLASAQTPSPSADKVFKNIQALKGMTVDDFLGSMGVMSAAVGFDCSECHNNAGTDKVDWAADDNAKKLIARGMVNMVANINKQNFNGVQKVTCWSCHHGRDRPSTTPSMEVVYGPGSMEMDDVLTNMPGQGSATEILDNYIKAVGGAQKLAGLKSYVATGNSIGFGGFGGGGDVHIYAQAPDKRTTRIQFKEKTERPDSTRAYNGVKGWIKTPLAVINEYELTGSELDGARVDAMLGFPGQIKTVLTNWRVSLPVTISDLPGPSAQTSEQPGAGGIGTDRVVNVVQGTGPNNTLVTLYFDKDSGLLLRMIRYGRTPIGRVPTQVDFADYKEVGGIKFPHRLIFAWLDGRDLIQIQKIDVNVPIEESKFGNPTSIPNR